MINSNVHEIHNVDLGPLVAYKHSHAISVSSPTYLSQNVFRHVPYCTLTVQLSLQHNHITTLFRL